MTNKKLFLYVSVALIIGAISGGTYVSNYGTSLPLQGTGQVSKADFMMVEYGDLGDCGLKGTPSCNCTYETRKGQIRNGTVVHWEGLGYVCQSSTGWSRNYEVE